MNGFGAARPRRDDKGQESVCRFDPTARRLIDFRLAGVDGKWVSLRDIDADVILLDFWGSWCAPCRTSVAHLMELQTELGAKRQIQTTGDERYSRIPSTPRPNTNAPSASRAVERRWAPAYDNSRISRHFLAQSRNLGYDPR